MAKIRVENDAWIKQWKRTKTYKALIDKTRIIYEVPLFQKERNELLRLFPVTSNQSRQFCDKWNIDFEAFKKDPHRSAYDGLGSDELPLKGITATLPIDFSTSMPGYREKFVTIKITNPMNEQSWKDIWLQVGRLQEDVFGKTLKGRPKSRPYHREHDKKTPIERGKEIYGSHVDSSWQVNFSSVSIKDISEKLAAMSKREKKYFCYSLSRNLGKSNRELHRIFKVSKDTIRNWITNVETWSEDERRAVESEIITSRNLPNKDIYDVPNSVMPLDGIEYSVTNKGIYNTGQKKKHKSSGKAHEY